MIHIKDEWYISPNAYEYTLGRLVERVDKKTGQTLPTFIAEAHCTTLGHALKSYRDKAIARKLTDGTYEVADIIDVIKEADKEWEELKGRLNV